MHATPRAGDPADEPVRIVPLRRRHLRRVLRIERQVYPRPWTPGIFQGELGITDGSRHYVGAWVGRQLVGYAGLMRTLDEGHVTNIAVDPAWQRHHLGTRLLYTLATWARAQGCTALTLEVRVSNQAAQAMYRRFGFAPAGIRHRYYEDTEDAIVMWAHDVHEAGYAARLVELLGAVPGTTTWAPGTRGEA
jgi:ribosomal-protein-alanine N-acetyltransferase